MNATIRMSSRSHQPSSVPAKNERERARGSRGPPARRSRGSRRRPGPPRASRARRGRARRARRASRRRRPRRPCRAAARSTGRSSTRPMKLLREGPTRIGRSSDASSGSRRSVSRLWPASLEKPMPGIDERVLARHARRARRARAPSRARPSPRPSRRGRRAPGARSAKPPRRCISTAGTPRSRYQRRHRGIVAEAAHVVHDVGAGVERGLRHLGLAGVDRDRPRAAAHERLDHGHDAAAAPRRPAPAKRPAASTRRPRPPSRRPPRTGAARARRRRPPARRPPRRTSRA